MTELGRSVSRHFRPMSHRGGDPVRLAQVHPTAMRIIAVKPSGFGVGAAMRPHVRNRSRRPASVCCELRLLGCPRSMYPSL